MSLPAPIWRSTLAMAAMDLRLTARRGENLLVMIVIPAAVLVFFATFSVVATPGARVDFLLGGAIALAIVATGLVNLGIATAYERHYGVLKRLGGSPLTRSGLVAAKLLSVLVIEIGQVILLFGIAFIALGWRLPPSFSLPVLALALTLGTVVFAGLGLALAGTLRAETVLALANLLFLVFLAVSGIVVSLDQLPDWLAAASRLLPATALSEVVRIALGAGGDGRADALPPTAVLAAWSVLAAAALTAFRWD
jgi:ABC-2 type transport system permease protein